MPIAMFGLLPIEGSWFLRFEKLLKEFFSNHPVPLSKEGSTFSPSPSSSGSGDVTALLGARNRFALRLADHQRSRQIVRDGTALLILACELVMAWVLLACGLLMELVMGLLIGLVLLVCGLLMELLMGLVLLACDLLMDLLLSKCW